MKRTIKKHRSDVLDDMPNLKAGEGTEKAQEYRINDINDYLRKTEIRTHYDRVIDHVAGPHRKVDLEIYKYAINKYLKGERLKYTDLPHNLSSIKIEKAFLIDSRLLTRTLQHLILFWLILLKMDIIMFIRISITSISYSKRSCQIAILSRQL